MSRVYLVPPEKAGEGYDALTADYELLRKSAEHGREGPHRLSDDPETADVVLFVNSRDPLNRDIRRHPLARRYPAKVVVYDSQDRPIPFFRGIYPSIERRQYRPARVRSGFYLRYSDSETVRYTDPVTTPRFLYGFTGAATTHPVRRALLRLAGPAGLVRDTSDEPGRGYKQKQQVYAEYKRRYGDELAAVRFVLCPRGVGTGSIRLFEAMKAGRAPVIISDDWVEPSGPVWSEFSLRFGESGVQELPARLAAEASRAAEMGRLARAAWEEWFAPDAAFQVLSAWATDLQRRDWPTERYAQWLVRLQATRWHTLRHHVLGPIVRRMLGFRARSPSPAKRKQLRF